MCIYKMGTCRYNHVLQCIPRISMYTYWRSFVNLFVNYGYSDTGSVYLTPHFVDVLMCCRLTLFSVISIISGSEKQNKYVVHCFRSELSMLIHDFEFCTRHPGLLINILFRFLSSNFTSKSLCLTFLRESFLRFDPII